MNVNKCRMLDEIEEVHRQKQMQNSQTNVEFTDKNKCRMLDEIEEVHRQKQNNLHLVFDGPKSFMEEDL